MITFILGASAAVTVGVIVWLIISVIKMDKQVKQNEEQIKKVWLEIQHRCDSIERNLDASINELIGRIDRSYQHTDSRIDKVINHIEREYVTKKNKMDNTIDYNN